MKDFRADLHIHSVLSPCGDLEMSPRNIIRRATELQLDIIGICDHNSTRHGPLMRRLGRENGIFVLTGAEVTSREEVHCLAFFENDEQLSVFQKFLNEYLIYFPNDPSRFGHQLVVDEFDNILEEEKYLLISAIDRSLSQIGEMVHRLDGLFIPAHINRERNSIISQLGFVPSETGADALEISRHVRKDDFIALYGYLSDYTFIQSSDAHFPEDIGRACSVFRMKSAGFKEIGKALAGDEGRKVVLP